MGGCGACQAGCQGGCKRQAGGRAGTCCCAARSRASRLHAPPARHPSPLARALTLDADAHASVPGRVVQLVRLPSHVNSKVGGASLRRRPLSVVLRRRRRRASSGHEGAAGGRPGGGKHRAAARAVAAAVAAASFARGRCWRGLRLGRMLLRRRRLGLVLGTCRRQHARHVAPCRLQLLPEHLHVGGAHHGCSRGTPAGGDETATCRAPTRGGPSARARSPLPLPRPRLTHHQPTPPSPPLHSLRQFTD